jgi:TetR/AcrR family transcriptional regulator, cholesterol catabolism regulator
MATPHAALSDMGPASKAGRTRSRILDAAAVVLNRDGYAGTRLGDIADIAGLQTPAIYYHFSSREDVIEAVIEVGQRAVIRHVTEAIDAVPAEAPELDRILAAVAAHLEVVLTLSQYASASVRNFAQLPQDMRERQMVHRLEYAAIWRDLFNKSAAQGDFGPVLDTSIARMLIMGALSWTPEWWDPERGSLDEIVASAQELVRRGLSAAKSRPPASRKTAPPASRKTAPASSKTTPASSKTTPRRGKTTGKR